MQIDISGLEEIADDQQHDIAEIINKILLSADLEEDYCINISLVDAETMSELNFRFKKKHGLTDVLSFPLPDMEKSFAHSKNILGDVVICIEQAQLQANNLGHSLKEEIAVLTAHGFFHLLGYDHDISKAEANRQMQAEMYLLDKAGIMPELSLIGRI